jgi:hypothetical protein
MKKYSLPFYVFAALLILTIPFSFYNFSLDFATSVVPGWHTTIFPPYFLINLIVSIVILLVVIAYWNLSRKMKKVSWTVFFIQLVLTIPAVLYILFPSFMDKLLFQHDEPINLRLILSIILAPYVLFIVGQVFFFFNYFKTIKAKRVGA